MIDLEDFEVASLTYKSDRAYDEGVRFGPALSLTQAPCPAEWLAKAVEDALNTAQRAGVEARPVHVHAPVAALLHPSTPTACANAARRTGCLPQEVCLDFADADFACQIDAFGSVRALRKVGLRVGMDARRAWNTPANAPLCLLLDTVHITADKLGDEDQIERIAAAHDCGVAIAVHGAYWRDADTLKEMGARFLVAPTADA